MTKEEVLEKLNAAFGSIRFEPSGHRYWFEGDESTELESVTTVVGKLHKPFESEKWATKKALQRKVTKEIILAEWDENARRACDKGTLTHYYMECFYTGRKFVVPEDLTRPEIVKAFEDTKKCCRQFMVQNHETLIPVASEFKVGKKEWKLVGTIDQLFLDSNGDLWIYDWKTNKKFSTGNSWDNLLSPFDFMQDSSLNGYSIQLGLYRKIVEDCTGLKVRGCRLVWLPENGDSYKQYDCVFLKNEIDAFVNSRMASFNKDFSQPL